MGRQTIFVGRLEFTIRKIGSDATINRMATHYPEDGRTCKV